MNNLARTPDLNQADDFLEALDPGASRKTRPLLR
jgi:hypothetical protein